jgi:hypothetical protein
VLRIVPLSWAFRKSPALVRAQPWCERSLGEGEASFIKRSAPGAGALDGADTNRRTWTRYYFVLEGASLSFFLAESLLVDPPKPSATAAQSTDQASFPITPQVGRRHSARHRVRASFGASSV